MVDFDFFYGCFLRRGKVLIEKRGGILILLGGSRRVAEVGSLPGSQASGIGV